MATALPGIRACVFDAYGTLFDYASAAVGCREALGERLGPLTALWRDKQLQYTWLRALTGRDALERWYDFSNKSEAAALREWCAENGIDLSGT